MARSEDALKRRADKRQRSEGEQRQADREDMQKSTKRRLEEEKKAAQTLNNNEEDPMKEAGAWKCTGCGNENFASRNWCNSTTCNESRPYQFGPPSSRGGPPTTGRRDEKRSGSQPNPALDEPGAWDCDSCGNRNFASRDVCHSKTCHQQRPGAPPSRDRAKPNKAPRHDEATSKTVVWGKQADRNTVSKNQELRDRYQETGEEGMEPEEIERAKLLIARSERKRQKKENKLKEEKEKDEGDDKAESNNKPTKEAVESEQNNGEESSKPKTDLKSKRDQNKALRKRYSETVGKGMKPHQIERAKTLIERDERKRNKKAELEGKTDKETVAAQ
jgi:hypothetical protein